MFIILSHTTRNLLKTLGSLGKSTIIRLQLVWTSVQSDLEPEIVRSRKSCAGKYFHDTFFSVWRHVWKGNYWWSEKWLLWPWRGAWIWDKIREIPNNTVPADCVSDFLERNFQQRIHFHCGNFKLQVGCSEIIFYQNFRVCSTKGPPETFSRCKVPECEDNGEIFQPAWLNKTVPIVVDTKFPEKCERYKPISDNSTRVDDSCTLESFNQSETVKCSEYVYEDDEITILKPVSGFWSLSMSQWFINPNSSSISTVTKSSIYRWLARSTTSVKCWVIWLRDSYRTGE